MEGSLRKNNISENSTFRAEFFAFRTPLLPIDDFVEWGKGLVAPTLLHDRDRLELALLKDRRRLRAFLKKVIERPYVRDAIFVASPSLYKRLDLWFLDPESKKGRKIELPIMRYFERMVGRPTPFGLFAGCSVGVVGSETQLAIEGLGQYRRHTRLDMDYVCSLINSLVTDRSIQERLCYKPNSTLYRAAGRKRYIEMRQRGTTCSYHLVAIDDTDYLETVLTCAKDGTDLQSLVNAIVSTHEDVSRDEAQQFVLKLIENQVLISNLDPHLTGAEPIHTLIEELSVWPDLKPVLNKLEQVQRSIRTIDENGLGSKPNNYLAVAQLLEELTPKVDVSRLFQVDLIKPSPDATLGDSVVKEILLGVEILYLFAHSGSTDSLEEFRVAFSRRYGEREVPLLEVLDEEMGIGFQSSAFVTADDKTPQDIFRRRGLNQPSIAWRAREEYLFERLTRALELNEHEVVLEPDDLKMLESERVLPLPDCFAVMATLGATSEAALKVGNFRVLINSVFGPSGATLLGRFCYADEVLRRFVEKHLRMEEALEPGAIFAEIVHLPEGRMGNIIRRPRLRDYEIPFLARASVPDDHQIPVTDLRVSVRNGRIILRSARREREVIPRLTSAHNYGWESLSIYRFLCALQLQKTVAGLSWQWAPFETSCFLPRIRVGRLVLSRARWRLSHEDLEAFEKTTGVNRYLAVQSWRAKNRIPRFVMISGEGSELPVDLDNVLSTEGFVATMKGTGGGAVEEMFPPPSDVCAHGPEGRFVHELVVPFVRKRTPSIPRRNLALTTVQSHCRTFTPYSEWLYLKLYTGHSTADAVLRQFVRPLVSKVLISGLSDQWFFIRYEDPDWHLRLRFHGHSTQFQSALLPEVVNLLAPFLEERTVWRAQIDTYEREVERYGGIDGVMLAEKFFYADSEAVLSIIESLSSDPDPQDRWRIGALGIHMLLEDFGMSLQLKYELMKHLREQWIMSLRSDLRHHDILRSKFTEERQTLETLLKANRINDQLSSTHLALRRRSEMLSPLITELSALDKSDQLVPPLIEIIPSYLHMYVNRLFPSTDSMHELTLYDCLARFYRSQIAKMRTKLS